MPHPPAPLLDELSVSECISSGNAVQEITVLAAASRKGPWQGAALKASGSAPHEARGTFATWRAAASPESRSQHTARQSFITECLQGAAWIKGSAHTGSSGSNVQRAWFLPCQPRCSCRQGGLKHSRLWSAQQDPRFRSAKAFQRHRIFSTAKRLPQVSVHPRQITLDQLEANAFRLN